MENEKKIVSFDLANKIDRLKIAGIVKAEFNINISDDDAIFIFLRMYQFTVSENILYLLTQIKDTKDDFENLFKKQDDDFLKHFSNAMEALKVQGNLVHSSKINELNSVGKALEKQIADAVTARLDSISSQLVNRIELNQKINNTESKYKFYVGFIGGFIFAVIFIFFVLFTKRYL